MQAQISLPSTIFLPTIFLPNHSKPMTQRHLNGVPPSMSALSSIAGELRAFPTNVQGDRAAKGRTDQHAGRKCRFGPPDGSAASLSHPHGVSIPDSVNLVQLG
jgi:hypothetical protein